MQLTNEQYEFIKGEIIALFEHYDICCIPINGFEIAYKMGMNWRNLSYQPHRRHVCIQLLSEMAGV